jgi:hypothetical protein
MPNPAYALVVWSFYPLWLLAAGLDYLCHRRSRIEHTAGLKESYLHLWQFACMVLLVLATALFVATGLILGLQCLLLLAHTLLSYVDVRYSQPRRHISALEQHVHGFLVVLPIAAIAVVATLEWQLASHQRVGELAPASAIHFTAHCADAQPVAGWHAGARRVLAHRARGYVGFTTMK